MSDYFFDDLDALDASLEEWGAELSVDVGLGIQADIELARGLQQERDQGAWRKGVPASEITQAWDAHIREKSCGLMNGARADDWIRLWSGPGQPPLEHSPA